MKQIKIIGSLLLLILSSACIKEDLDDCGIYVYFSYLGDFNTEIFPQKIERVNMYVYDESGTLVQTSTFDRDELRLSQGTMLDLPNGSYHLVCWGNANEMTQMNNHTSLGSATVAAPHYFTREVITTNDSLYFGMKDIVVHGDRWEQDTVYFNSSHIKMRVEIVGVENEATIPMQVEIGNLSPTVDFARNFSSEKEHYYPIVQSESTTGKSVANFNVLRFHDDNDVFVNLVNPETGESIYNLSLKDFMQRNNITVNGINEAFVGIRFKVNGLSVTVTAWEEEEIKPGYN